METQAAATVPKIHAAIMAVMEDIDAIEKKRRNLGQNFMFRGVAETLATCHPLFIKHKMYVHPLRVSHHSMDANQDKDGKPRGTHVFQTIVYRATSAEDGSFIDGEASGEAIDYQDKSSGKVMSISFKCFIFQLFCIPEEKNESDPDEYTPNGDGTGKATESKAEAKPAEQPKSTDKKPSPIKMLIAKTAQAGKVEKADVLGWMSKQLGREVKATKDLTDAEVAQLTKTVDEILKEMK
jgi:hypothetical protein